MIWHIIRYWLTFFIPLFYKKIGIRNGGRLSVKGPVIIAMNHPNAFADSFIISYVTFPVRLKYLARGDAFKPGLISLLLDIIGIIPIYRIQDGGKEGLTKNNSSYKKVNSLLKKNAKLIVFAEGICIQERRLKPLKKGVARMVFGAYEAIHNEQLMVLPVGINYDNPSKFRSTVFYNVGEPIYVKDFFDSYQKNPAKTNKHFLEVLEHKMKSLITQTNDKKNDEVVLYIEALCKKDWLKREKSKKGNLEPEFNVTKKITDLVNQAAIHNPSVLDDFKTKAEIYFKELKKYQLRDWLLNEHQNKSVNLTYLILRLLALMCFFPFHLIGLIGNFLPLYLTHQLTLKSIKKKEFYASVAIGLAMVIFLINYLIIYFISHAFTLNFFISITHCLVFAICGRFSIYYRVLFCKTRGVINVLKNKKVTLQLKKERKILITLINSL